MKKLKTMSRVLLLMSVFYSAQASEAPVSEATLGERVAQGAENIAAPLNTAPIERGENAAPVHEVSMPTPAVSDMTGDSRGVQRPAASTYVSSSLDSEQAASDQSDQVEHVVNNPFSPDVSQPLTGRVAALEQQMQNLTQTSVRQQLDEIQQQLERLNGELQVQQHDLKLLNQQQRTFYQDLDRRIKRIETPKAEPADLTRRSVPPKKPLKQPKHSVSAKEAQRYHAAFRLVAKRHYARAQVALQGYLNAYPKGEFRSNAHYWLGDLYLKDKQMAKAAGEFRWILSNTPASAKVPEARLKLAMTELGLGHTAAAKEGFIALQRQYPGTTPAQLAAIQLKRLQLK